MAKSKRKVIPEVLPEHRYHYQTSDKFLIVNDGDVDLKPIHVPLPERPAWNEIAGYGLEPKLQKWTPIVMPPRLKHIVHLKITNREKWKMLNENRDAYKIEIEYIEKMWDYRINGYWFYNNGKATWITGDHFFFLNFWRIDIGMPQFRSRGRKFYIFKWFCDGDPASYGFAYPKMRREGATTNVKCCEFNIASRTANFHSGMQSMTFNSAEALFMKHVVEPWRKLPFFFQPVHDGTTNPKSGMFFYAPAYKATEDNVKEMVTEALESSMTFKDSGIKAYDGLKIHFYHDDECGKCFAKGTQILMYDGSVKNVEDIIVGDRLMGDDSTPRIVKSLARGKEMMYEVSSKKFMNYTCNESHILSLKFSSAKKLNGNKKNDTLNISISDYLNLSKQAKQHLMLHKVGVEYPAQKHMIPSYLFGLWLGDGNSHDTRITSIDKEVIQYINQYATTNSLRVSKSDKINYAICGTTKKKVTQLSPEGVVINQFLSVTDAAASVGVPGSNISLSHRTGQRIAGSTWKIEEYNNNFANFLRTNNLYQNKHIPNNFLIDSRENRLQLLAGLIDSDGHKCVRKNVPLHRQYEITSIRKNLAEQIHRLSNSLGFYSSINKKNTSMKRADGTMYRGIAYRIMIYGKNLHEVPCKIKRKKYSEPESDHTNRNPLRCSFKLTKKGIGEYYGFTLTGNRLFLLADYQVAHNTEEVDIYARWRVVKPCLRVGSTIIGKSIHTSTVGEMEKGGGQAFRQLCNDSKYEDRDKNGQTKSGLYILFIPSSDGLEGNDPQTGLPFIDQYGNSNIEAAERYLRNMREAYERDNDYDSLADIIREAPLTYKECWRSSAKQSNFNNIVLQARLDELSIDNPGKVRGNFKWKGDVKDTEVFFEPSDQGRFYVSYLFDHPNQANRALWDGGIRLPANTAFFIAGADPYRFKQTLQKKKSDGAGAVFMKDNMAVDPPGLDKSKKKTHRFCCTYSFRPRDKNEYGEDMIKMCVYYGCEMFPEINVDFIWDYFEERGYGGYLFYRKDPKTGLSLRTPGQTTTEKTREAIFTEYHTYIEQHGMREVHDEILTQCMAIENDMTDFDLFVAGGYALMGAKRQVVQLYDEELTLNDYLDTYEVDNSGQSKLFVPKEKEKSVKDKIYGHAHDS